jgi:hypothetical protein
VARWRRLLQHLLAGVADLTLVLTDLRLALVDSTLMAPPANLRRARLRRDPRSKL